MRLFSPANNYFLLFFFSNICIANAVVFSGDITLEIFAFMPREDITCEALYREDPDIFKEPFAREKADRVNNGGSLSFLLKGIPAQVGVIIFIRAINLTTKIVHAFGCMENVHAATGEQKEIHLYLTPDAVLK